VLEFGQCPSKEVTESVDQIVTAIADIVKELRKPAVA
jgi:hypothetical protein